MHERRHDGHSWSHANRLSLERLLQGRGKAELVITPQAKLAVLARASVPELFADVMGLVDRLLPAATGHAGGIAKLGRSSGSEWAPSELTVPTYSAAQRENEL
jgi:hypothetical protein